MAHLDMVFRPSTDQTEGPTRHFLAPERNPHFVGRNDIVGQLEDFFRDSTGPRRVALHGIGGVG